MTSASAPTIHDDPTLAPILHRLEDANARRAELERESRMIHQTISPYAVFDGPANVSAAEQLRMENRAPEVIRALRGVLVEIHEIERERRTTTDRVRAQRAMARVPRKREIVKRIEREGEALAESMRALAAIEEEDEADGVGIDRLAWLDVFGLPSPVHTPRWPYFLAFVRRHGLLD